MLMNGNRKTVEVQCNDFVVEVYEELGWRDWKKSRILSGKISKGDMTIVNMPDDVLAHDTYDEIVDKTYDAASSKILLWVKKWTLKEALSAENIGLLSQDDYSAIMNAISDREIELIRLAQKKVTSEEQSEELPKTS